MTLPAAVVGTGFIGPVHVEALRRLGVPVRGVLGSTPERGRAAAAALGLPHSYDSFDELLADGAVRVVHLASPNRLHFDQCRRTLQAGKHVVCEKPLAMTPAETAELVALAARTPAVAAVCYNVRFYPLCLHARHLCRGGGLGPVFHVTGSYHQDWLLLDTDFNWRVLADDGGDLRAVADIGTHWLDLIAFVTGLEVEAVCADLRTVHPTRRRPAGPVETFANAGTAERVPVEVRTEDYGALLVRFRGGARGCVTVSQVAAGRKNSLRFEAACADGAVAWDSERPDELWLGRRGRPSELVPRDPALLGAAARPHSDYPAGHVEGFPDTFKQLFRAIYADAAAREAGRPAAAEPLYATFADGHREVALCAAVARSAREGRWMDVAVGSRQ
jgi:predicted dehydrogenase